MKVPKRFWLLLTSLVVLLAACGATTWWLLQPDATLHAPPQVTVRAPTQGAQVPLGQPVVVQAGAYTTAPRAQIARLLLWADGRLVGEKPGPANPLSNAWQWTPTTPGSHTLVLQAIDTAGRKAAAYRTVEVQPAADDADGDGIPDDQDACPNQVGPTTNQGCPPPPPDRDHDGVPDDQDTCPDQAGPATNAGCPETTPDDADGDGVPDTTDLCPDHPGPADNQGCPAPTDTDGDGVPDWNDPCPLEFGFPGGCPPAPDQDGDGVPDRLDACPDQPGPGEMLGCPTPDADHDGVPDDQDACPDQAGPATNAGCPETTPDDADGDGVSDNQDACPNDPGPVDHNGCPLPDADGDGVPDDQDACPDQAGLQSNEGCPQPDADGDGVPDDQDACPDQAGPADNDGCSLTDNDGDGIPNDVDQCPDLSGDPALQGCPPWLRDFPAVDVLQPRVCAWMPALCGLNQDADGDGVADGQDACPNEPGPALNNGCPWDFLNPNWAFPPMPCPTFLPPSVCETLHQSGLEDWWQTWQEDLPADEEPVEPPPRIVLRLDEPAVLTETGWLRLYCTARLGDSDWFPLDHGLWTTTDGQNWFLDDDYREIPLEGLSPQGLQVALMCWGWRDFVEGEVYLGVAEVAHPWQPEVDTWEVQIPSTGSVRGERFWVTMQVAQCWSGSCP